MPVATLLSGHESFPTAAAVAGERHREARHVDGGRADVAEATIENLRIDVDRLEAGDAFAEHDHLQDQLAWMTGGSILVTAAAERWHVGRDHLIWIPARHRHAMRAVEGGDLLSLYADSRCRPGGERWAHPQVVATDPLIESLLRHLREPLRTPERQRQCLELLQGLLQEQPAVHDAVALPATRAHASSPRHWWPILPTLAN